jgi:iron complex transport system ATP-binding protein
MTGLDRFCLTMGSRQVLHDITLRPERGAMLALCGPNGAGKTSILRALAGLLSGSPPPHPPPPHPPPPHPPLPRPPPPPAAPRPNPRQVAYLPQNAHASWPLTVEQIVTLGRIPHGDAAAAPIDNALRQCGIEALRHARIDRISGGEARRAMLARVFATEPEMFLLDEPTADLDPAASHAILRLLRETAEAGAAVVVVLHAVELAAEYAHRVVLVDRGRIVADRPAATVLEEAAALFGMRAGTGSRLLPLI